MQTKHRHGLKSCGQECGAAASSFECGSLSRGTEGLYVIDCAMIAASCHRSLRPVPPPASACWLCM